ncbi:MAG TPA: MDR family oxidoreductase [Gemmatimonadales bacterium]|nr:MDR family oxidoreductase [Gemmatimonadales bacterium]
MRAILLTREEGRFRAELTDLTEARLIEGTPGADVTVAVEYSTINYKDGLALTDRAPVIRAWPMVPGIDAAGIVASSTDPRWRAGDRVLVNGCGIGELHWGGLAERARFRGEWLLATPEELSNRQAMAIGTAGYTAMLSVMALEDHGLRPAGGEILVTGATGGVGSIAIALLARAGYRVVASTGKTSETDYLHRLGASEIIDRETLTAPGKPLQKERWAGVVDSIGSHTLANACAQTRADGVVAACGLAQGMDFPATVAPFILRGVTLAGIFSGGCDTARRARAWEGLTRLLDRTLLDGLTREVALSESFAVAREILEGRIRGRVVVDVNR